MNAHYVQLMLVKICAFFSCWVARVPLYSCFSCPSNPPTLWHSQATECRQLAYFHVIASLLGMTKVSKKRELEEDRLRAGQMELCPLMKLVETGNCVIWQKLAEGQRQWRSWSCDPISRMSDSVWGRRIWKRDNTFTLWMWIYTEYMSEAIVLGVEVIFAPCPGAKVPGTPWKVVNWRPFPNLAWSSFRSRFPRISLLPFCSGILEVISFVFFKRQIL